MRTNGETSSSALSAGLTTRSVTCSCISTSIPHCAQFAPKRKRPLSKYHHKRSRFTESLFLSANKKFDGISTVFFLFPQPIANEAVASGETATSRTENARDRPDKSSPRRAVLPHVGMFYNCCYVQVEGRHRSHAPASKPDNYPCRYKKLCKRGITDSSSPRLAYILH